MYYFVIYVTCLSCCLVCLLQPCDHLLERAKLLALLYEMFSCVFVTFSYDVLGQVLYLITFFLSCLNKQDIDKELDINLVL